jgi:glycosyltransferase involved in cell wall biosynthesis
LGLSEKLVVIYAGIFGIAQGLETIIDTAKILSDQPNVHFLLIGDGPKKQEIIRLVERFRLSNITILNEKPRQQIPDYLSAADVALIPLRKIDLFKGALPSKIFDAWACQIPIILSVDGEARKIMEQAQAGIYTPPEDPQKLSEAIIWMMENQPARIKMGSSGRNFTEQYYSRQVLAETLALELEKVIQ